MQYTGENIVAKVYTIPSHLIHFKRSIIYDGRLGVSLYVRLSRMLYSHNTHTVTRVRSGDCLSHSCTTSCCRKKMQMADYSGRCKYVFGFLFPDNPQDPQNDFVRDETQERRGVHVHAPVVAMP